MEITTIDPCNFAGFTQNAAAILLCATIYLIEEFGSEKVAIQDENTLFHLTTILLIVHASYHLVQAVLLRFFQTTEAKLLSSVLSILVFTTTQIFLAPMMNEVVPQAKGRSIALVFLRTNSIVILLAIPYLYAQQHLGNLLRFESVVFGIREGQLETREGKTDGPSFKQKANGSGRFNWQAFPENDIILEDDEEQRNSTVKKVRGPVGVDEGLQSLEMSQRVIQHLSAEKKSISGVMKSSADLSKEAAQQNTKDENSENLRTSQNPSPERSPHDKMGENVFSDLEPQKQGNECYYSPCQTHRSKDFVHQGQNIIRDGAIHAKKQRK